MKFAQFSNIAKLSALMAALLLIGKVSSQDASRQLDITAELFKCLTEMTRSASGAYFVDNILGDLEATKAVADSEVGGRFPPGSLISLIPTEVMVKHEEGWNDATNDWEFIELTVSEEGSEIVRRGTTDVMNRFGGNCFDCHKLARPEWDFICGVDHGCDPLPIGRDVLFNIQAQDPRCIKED